MTEGVLRPGLGRTADSHIAKGAASTDASPPPVERPPPASTPAAVLEHSSACNSHSSIVSVATKTALPEGCFQLTKINDAGQKVSVKAKKKGNGDSGWR